MCLCLFPDEALKGRCSHFPNFEREKRNKRRISLSSSFPRLTSFPCQEKKKKTCSNVDAGEIEKAASRLQAGRHTTGENSRFCRENKREFLNISVFSLYNIFSKFYLAFTYFTRHHNYAYPISRIMQIAHKRKKKNLNASSLMKSEPPSPLP